MYGELWSSWYGVKFPRHLRKEKKNLQKPKICLH
jgi:hypothetical protein